MPKEVNLTIDGQRVQVSAGTLIVDAAKKIGIDIPVFCYHPKMEPAGMCRMCLVEVGRPVIDRATSLPELNPDGSPKIQFGPKLETSCTVPVSEGMVVIGMSEKVKSARQDVLEFLLTSHPLDCPVCDKGGECPLQNLTMGFGPGESRYRYDEKNHLAKHVPLGELIYLDRERCIQCGRCVRFQQELADDPVIGFYNRGRSLEIMTTSNPGFDSIFSGNTTDICPVGALTTADFRFGARPWELKSAASICTHCPVGCNMTYNTRREAKSDGKVVIKRAMPRQNEAVNEIWICDKGRFGYHYAESPTRLTTPLVRKNGKLEPVGWDEAITLVSEKIRDFSFNFTVLAGGRLANEDLYNLKELSDTLQGKKLLYSTMAGGDLVAKVGLDSESNLGDLGQGTVILVVACDLHEEAPVYWLRIKNAVKRGAKLIVANGRDTRLDKFADFAIRYPFGREVDAVNSLLPGASPEDEISKLIAIAENLVILYGSDGVSYKSSQALSVACAQLLKQTGHAGKKNNGLLAVWQQANDQGAWDIGYRPSDHLDADLEHAGVIYIAGADPAGDCPGCHKAIEKSNFVIVQDLFMTATAKLADVVFPAQSTMEREGTFTNGERRVQRFFPVINPVPGTLSDFEIASRVRQQVARMNLDNPNASQVFLALAAHIPDYGSLTYQKLSTTMEQWPIIGRSDLYYGGTSYDNHQGLGCKLSTTAERRDPYELPIVVPPVIHPVEGELTAFPITVLYDRGGTVAVSDILEERISKPFIIIHPDTAVKLKLDEGGKAKVTLMGNLYPVDVKFDATIPTSAVLVPRSMGLPALDPMPIQITRS